MKFSRSRRIRFSDCDPAGIVFYPKYFVFFNDLLEEWIDNILPGGFAGYILGARVGMPTVRLEADFKKISRMGDDVTLVLNVARVGERSFELHFECQGADDGAVRMAVKQTLVTTSLESHRAIQIPPQLRAALLRVQADQPTVDGATP